MRSPLYRHSKRIVLGLVGLALSCPTVKAATIAYWRFEEGPASAQANVVLDSSGNGLSGTAINGPIYQTDVPTSIIPATATPDHYSLQFNGTSQRVFVPDSPKLALTKSLTVEAYIKVFGQLSVANDIVFRGDDRIGLDPYVLNVINGNLFFGINQVSAFAPVPLNTWVHVAGELDDSTGRISVWINGTLANAVFTNQRPIGSLDPNSNPGLGIGNVQSSNYNQYFDGRIDEVRISDQALAPSEFLPEPSSIGLIAVGALTLSARRRRPTQATH